MHSIPLRNTDGKGACDDPKYFITYTVKADARSEVALQGRKISIPKTRQLIEHDDKCGGSEGNTDWDKYRKNPGKSEHPEYQPRRPAGVQSERASSGDTCGEEAPLIVPFPESYT
jgi:hypothetical protein